MTTTTSEAQPVPSATLREGCAVIARGIKDQPRWFALAVLGSTLYGVMTGAMAWAIGYVTDRAVAPAIAAGHATAQQLLLIGGTLLAVLVLNTLGVIGRRLAGGTALFNLGADYRRRVTRQYLRLPLSWHHRHPSGQLLSNANADVEATWNIFAPLPMSLGVIVMLVFGLVQMLVIDPWLALVGLVVFPLLLAANLVFSARMSPRITRAQQLRAEVSEVAHESFEAGLVVKSLGREDHEARRFGEVSARLREANIEVGRTRGMFDPIIEAIPTVGTLAVLLVGSLRMRSQAITAAEMVQIAYLFSVMAFPVRALGWVLGDMPRSVVGWKRISAVLEAEGSMAYGEQLLPAAEPLAARTDGVDYAYDVPDDQGSVQRHLALRNVTVEVPAGATVALVGPTGSGKSTLTSLFLRLVDPDSGTVTVGGAQLRTLAHGALAEVAALVPQHTFMFDDTVRGNVTLGGAYSDEQVWRALAIAQADGFVRRLPLGLDTTVAERGATLSGGQRQRLSLARAVVRHPQLLVLDDATSALDPTVEQAILANLRQVSRNMTVLVIAYRLATIRLADHVVYINAGEVLGHGTHDELLQRCPGYLDLVSAYQREADERAAIAGAATPAPRTAEQVQR